MTTAQINTKSRINRRIILVAIVLFLLLPFQSFGSINTNPLKPSEVSIDQTESSQIEITSNSDFDTTASNRGWPGDGTEGNPYIIEDIIIRSSNSQDILIKISSTNKYFVIRNVDLVGGQYGMELIAVANSKLINNTIAYSLTGIVISSSSNMVFDGNLIGGTNTAIYQYQNSGVNMTNNGFVQNQLDLELQNSDNGLIYDNYLSGYSMRLQDINKFNISSNIFNRTELFLFNGQQINIEHNQFHTFPIKIFGDSKIDVSRYSFENNTVNGKDIVYIANSTSYSIDGREGNYGQIILANSSNVHINYLKSVDIRNTIFMTFSSYVEVDNSVFTNSSVETFMTAYNQYHDNIFDNNIFAAFISYYSTNDSVYQNEFDTVNNGIIIERGTGVSIQNNNFIQVNNSIFLYGHAHGKLLSNNVESGQIGIELANAVYTNIENNVISTSQAGILKTQYSYYSSIKHNELHQSSITIGPNTSPSILIFDDGFYNNTINNKNILFKQDISNSQITEAFGQLILINGTDISISDKSLSDVDYGLHIINSAEIEITGLSMNGLSDIGIKIYNSENITISDNNLEGMPTALEVVLTDNIHILHSEFIQIDNVGIDVIGSKGSTVELIETNNVETAIRINHYLQGSTMVTSEFININNVNITNGGTGIDIIQAKDTRILNSIFIDNAKYAIQVRKAATSVSIFNNDFVNNNLGGTSQLYDDGDQTDFSSNYYHGWTTPDHNGDGVVDRPYPVDGMSNNIDSEPDIEPHFVVLPDESDPNNTTDDGSDSTDQNDTDGSAGFLNNNFFLIYTSSIIIIIIVRRKLSLHSS